MKRPKYIRWAAVWLAVLIAVLAPCSAYAAGSYTYTDRPVYFQRYTTTGWVDYVQKEYHLNSATGPMIFCLEGGKLFYTGDLTTKLGKDAMAAALNANSAASRLKAGISVDRYIQGLMVIAAWGYPNYIPEGMSAAEARYATSAAFHTYTGLSVRSPSTEGFGYSFWGEYEPTTRMRAKSGVANSQKVYNWYTQLYKKGLDLNTLPQSVSLAPAELQLADDGENFTGDITVTLVNMNRGYSIDPASLAAVEELGGSISGFTGASGDVLHISVPRTGNTERALELSVTAEDTRNFANFGMIVASSEPNRWQKLVGFVGNSGNMKKAASAALSTGSYGLAVSVQKQSADPELSASPLYSLEGAEFSLSGVGLDGGEITETIVTDAEGRAYSEKLFALGTQVTVSETKAPFGFEPAEDMQDRKSVV